MKKGNISILKNKAKLEKSEETDKALQKEKEVEEEVEDNQTKLNKFHRKNKKPLPNDQCCLIINHNIHYCMPIPFEYINYHKYFQF